MKKALVTGGAGFLGSAVVRRLLDRGVTVRVLALPNEPMDNLHFRPLEETVRDAIAYFRERGMTSV